MNKLLFNAVLAIALCCASNAFANFSGEDTFTGGMSENWSDQTKSGSGDLSYNSNAMKYSSSSGTANDRGFYTWTANQGDANNDWIVQIGAAIPNSWTWDPTSQVGDVVGCGLTIQKVGEGPGQYQVDLMMGHYTPDGSTDTKVIYTQRNDGAPTAQANADPGANVASTIRLRFDSSNQWLYPEYSFDGSTWYSLTIAAESNHAYYDLTNWNLSGTNQVNLIMFGVSQRQTVAMSDGFALDNFSAVPEPSSIAFFGMGLFGLIGAGIRRFKKS